jgi:hypothetical protein
MGDRTYHSCKLEIVESGGRRKVGFRLSGFFYDRINATLYDNYYTKDPTERLQLNQQSDEQFVAYILIVGADPIRYVETQVKRQMDY